MISTTMHLSPGAPIMKSYDLVNWEIVNYVFDRADISDSFSLRNGQSSYGQGQWASSIRYHDGKWYVAFNTNNLGGSYLYVTDDIDDGSWERIALGRAYHDPSLFFDLDGTPYIFYGSGSTSAVKLSSDLKTVVAEYPQILRHLGLPGLARSSAGSSRARRCSTSTASTTSSSSPGPRVRGARSRCSAPTRCSGRYATVDGSNPYEAKGVLNSNGFAQGSLVPIAAEDGSTDWSGMFFRDTFPIGRIPALIPATWSDGWPTFGNSGSVPVNGAFAKPIELSPEEELYERQKSIVVSDDFENDAPHRAYMDEDWTIPAPPSVDQSLLGVELLSNPGFENGTTGWIVNDTATLSPSTDAASGAGALQVTGRTTTGSGPAQDVSGKVQHSVTYDISAKVKYTTRTARRRSSSSSPRDTAAAPSRTSRASPRPAVSGPRSRAASRFRPRRACRPCASSSRRRGRRRPRTAPDTHLMDFTVDDLSLKGRPLTTEAPHPDEIAPNGSRLALPWQWNHAPDNRYWSLTDRDGWLRLTTSKVLTGQHEAPQARERRRGRPTSRRPATRSRSAPSGRVSRPRRSSTSRA